MTPDNSRQLLAKFNSIDDVENFLYSHLPSTKRTIFKGGHGLERSKQFFSLLGNPQDDFKSVHIAGTSGKGSTAYFLSYLLREHGFKVGTHVSPHVVDLRERFLINLKYMSDKQLVAIANGILPALRIMDESDYGLPTYFEMTIAIAFSHFANQKVDYAIIETGLGGRFDATNTINRSDKLAVISRIGLDHTEILGSTLPKIAYQKAGIITRNGRAIVLQPDSQAVVKVIEAEAKKQSATVSFVELPSNIQLIDNCVVFDAELDGHILKSLKLPSLGAYQAENAQLALTALNSLATRDGFVIDETALRRGIEKAFVPARAASLHYKDRLLIIDGAHNVQKMEAFVHSLKQRGLPEKAVWLIALKNDKDAKEILKIIDEVAQKVIFTTFFSRQALAQMQGKSTMPRRLQEIWQAISQAPSFIEPRPQIAFQHAVSESTKVQPIIISGSLYLAGEIMEILES